jgi:ribosomal protein S18 acetylase RimI-like enzyme
MEITTRTALVHEKNAILSLYEQAMRSHIEAIWGWNQSWQENDFDNAFQNSQTYVIENQSILLGYFQIDPNEDHDYLRMLILKPEVRSLGVGAKLLSQILGIAQYNGKALMLRVFKVNVDAKRFYEREGWMVIAEEEAFLLMGHPSNTNIKQPNNSLQRTAKSYAFVTGRLQTQENE